MIQIRCQSCNQLMYFEPAKFISPQSGRLVPDSDKPICNGCRHRRHERLNRDFVQRTGGQQTDSVTQEQ